MNIIVQFYKTPTNIVNSTLDILENINTNHIFIFSDNNLSLNNQKYKVIKKNAPLKWKAVFDFIYQNNFLNKEGTYVLEPNSNPVNTPNSEGILILNNGIWVKNIKKIPEIRRQIYKDYEFLRLNTEGGNFKVASICHLYYEDILEEVIEKHLNLYNTDFQVDFYFSLTNNNSTIGQKEWVKKKLKENFPKCEIFELPNKGLDIGPFFKIFKHIIDTNKRYDYIVKTHTKKSAKTSGSYFGNIWRKNLFSVLENLEKVKSHMEVGELMISSARWIIPLSKDNLNKEKVKDLRSEFGIQPAKGDQFVGGTMFWVKYSFLRKYFNSENLDKYYKKMELGYFFQVNAGDKEYITHSFERLFGIMVGNENKRIVGI